ncbi:MAG: sel1 repeat family protein [Burkholderiales bacterium]|nr:sel1 repeat family protein [Burkholderiales bacterium]
MIRYLLAALLLVPMLARADYQEGVQAYASGRYDEALVQFHKAAEAGDPQAIFFVGFLHHNGFGVPRNDAEAIKWFRRAADMNHYDSQYYMGKLSENGRGVEHDLVAAHKWYTLATKSAPNERDAAYSMREVRRVEKKLTPEQLGKAKELEASWKPVS